MAHGMTDGVIVPDLVFSDMKFLQNHHGRNDHNTQTPDAKKKRKKYPERMREEDISSFFTTARPLADTDGNIQTQSRRPTVSSAGAKVKSPRPMGDSFKAHAVPAAEPRGKTSYPSVGSKGQRSEGNSYFSWSESLRGSSITPGRPRETLIDNNERVDAYNGKTKEAMRGRSAAGHQEAPSSIIRDCVTAAPNRLRLSSAISVPAGLSRSQGMSNPSSPPRRSNLVDGAVNRHTDEGVTSPSSTPSILQGRSKAGLREAHRTEDSIGTPYVDNITELKQDQASRDDVGGY